MVSSTKKSKASGRKSLGGGYLASASLLLLPDVAPGYKIATSFSAPS